VHPDGIERLAPKSGVDFLFVDRARAVNPAFELNDDNTAAVVDICTRVDGLPLAIELAAARVRLISPAAICDRLSNRLALLATTSPGVSERQRTLRGTIQWSYDLLDEEEKALFRRLGVFLGGAPLPLITQVVAAEDELELLERLGSLIDKSLVRRAAEDGWDGALRVEMLESVREFAYEDLQAKGEAPEYRQRHALAFVELAEEAEPKLTGESGGRWLDRLESEHDNLRAAFGWAVEAGRGDVAARLCAALWRFWQMRGHLTEGRERAEQAVGMTAELADAGLRARLLGAVGSLAYWQADWLSARGHYQAALEARREEGDRRGMAEALYNLSFAYWVPNDDVQRGMDLAEEALALYRELDDRAGIANTLWALGGIANNMPAPQPEQALAYYGEASEHFQALGNRPMLAWSKFMSAGAHAKAARVAESRSATQDALRLFVELGDVSGYALCLHGLAVLEWVEGRRSEAVRLAGAAGAVARSSGVNLAESTSRRWLAYFGYAEDELEKAGSGQDPELVRAWQQGSALSLDEALAEAGGLE
jgi:tetratricopeptide (TPR) repeat protein